MAAKKDRDPHRGVPKDASGDDSWANHDNIPTDAEGVPIFFILPPSVKARYERDVDKGSKRTWLATGDPGALRKAAYDIKHHRQPMPDWFFDAIVTILTNMRSSDDVKRAHFAFLHSRRYQVVRDRVAKAADAGVKLSVDEASERASNALKGKLGSTEDVKRSYYKVKKALNQGLGAAFNMIHIPKGLPR
jgi:hypothetical protein